ncbi:MAG TPA: NADH-quinone oxidoreductase subunit H [Armatimonadota bacterium]|nr:NADH-quinone oxidoreductase subunit H [Armatimonadota bacterium]
MSASTIIVNGLIALLLAPLFDGVVRKVKAIIHSRKGPPITQVYIDILKLLGKEDLRCTASAIFRFAPAVALAAFLVVALLTPMGMPCAGLPGDMVTWIYFLTLGAAAIIVLAAASGNPFAEAGAAREIMMLLSVEPIVVAALITAAIKSGSMQLTDMTAWNISHGPAVSMVTAGIAFFLALQAALGKLPFDIAEAESEIVDGPLIELSGPKLATMKLALLIRQLVYCFLLVQIFIPWPVFSLWPLSVLAALVKVLILFVLAAVIEAVSPRLRIDQAISYTGRVLFVALAALVLAVIGV